VQIINVVKHLIYEENGQGMTEYALLIAFVAMALIVTVAAFEDKVWALFNKVILAIPVV
jgi:Flp pilus assembly pilin Flp